MPGLQARSPFGGAQEATDGCFPPSLSPKSINRGEDKRKIKGEFISHIRYLDNPHINYLNIETKTIKLLD